MGNAPSRNLWVDYLKSAITVLVVAHHAALAYTTFAWFDDKVYINSTHAVVDKERWIGLDVFVNFNDIFFMSLMFWIAGLYLYKSIDKKGRMLFLKDRVNRLLIPFFVAVTVLMMIAYFPAYYLSHPTINPIAFVKDYFTTERWPVGPPWFIWVLFVFNFLLLLFYPIVRRFNAAALARYFQRQPAACWLFLFAISWLLYVPVAYKVGAGTWTGLGPFDFQLSRLLLYFGYFVLGVFTGKTNFNAGILAAGGPVTRNWKTWIILAAAVFVVLTLVSPRLAMLVKSGRLTAFNGWMIYYALYVASCVCSCLAFVAGFRRHAHTSKRWWNSLSDNAYLIYLLHFIFINWVQFCLLNIRMPAIFKFTITFVLALALSWLTSIVLRRIQLVRKYL